MPALYTDANSHTVQKADDRGAILLGIESAPSSEDEDDDEDLHGVLEKQREI